MKPSIVQELHRVYDLSKVDFTPVTTLPLGLRPVTKSSTGSLACYRPGDDTVHFIGKGNFTMAEFDSLIADVFHARANNPRTWKE